MSSFWELSKCLFTVDPEKLTGEGEYNLNIIKEEEVTESFLGMDQSVRGCQNEEHYDECTTRQYIENMREKCGCLPLSIALSNQVIFFRYINNIQSYSSHFSSDQSNLNAGPCLQDNEWTSMQFYQKYEYG